MENARILLSFLIPLLVIFYLIHKKADPTFFLLVGAVLSGVISGLPLSTLMTTISSGFGSIVTMCGLIVVFGVVFSEFLSASGGIERLTCRIIKKTSPQGSIYAIYALGYVISIPINFTPAAALMMPLIKRLSAVSGRPVQAYACAFSTASFLTNCLVVPTMTPVMLASMAGIDMGWFILLGLGLSLILSLATSLAMALLLAKRYGSIERAQERPEEAPEEAERGPAVKLVFLLILLPIALIVAGTFLPGLLPEGGAVWELVTFLGKPESALFLSVLVEMAVLRPYLKEPAMGVFGRGLRVSGSYLIVLGAANAFGSVLTAGGLGECILSLVSGLEIPLLLLAWLMVLVLRAGTGVMTVAATATLPALMPAVLDAQVSPVLFVLALCVACVGLIIPTDPAFWFYKEGYGLSVRDTFISITLPGTIASVLGIVLILLFSLAAPAIPALF